MLDKIGTIIFCVVLTVGYAALLISDILSYREAKRQLEEGRKQGRIGIIK